MLRRVVTLGGSRRSAARVLSRQQARGSRQLQRATGLCDPSPPSYSSLCMKYGPSGSIQKRNYSSQFATEAFRAYLDEGMTVLTLGEREAEAPLEMIWKKKVDDWIECNELVAQIRDANNVLYPVLSSESGYLSIILAEHGLNDLDIGRPIAILADDPEVYKPHTVTLNKNYLQESQPEDWKALEKFSHSLIYMPPAMNPAESAPRFGVEVGAAVKQGDFIAVAGSSRLCAPVSGYVALRADTSDKAKPISAGDPIAAILLSEHDLKEYKRVRRLWRSQREEKEK